MPGQLKADAECPKCGDPLAALVDTTDTAGVLRVYYHGLKPGRVRRRRSCSRNFTDREAAARERRGLEVPQRG
jgi:hypothetical protein